MPSRLGLLGVSGPTSVIVPPSSFSPASIYGLERWYYQPDVDYSGGTWVDRASVPVNLVQATAGNRPTLSAVLAELNGKYGVGFDGVDDNIATATFTALPQPLTVLSVLRQRTVTASDYLYDGSLNTLGLNQSAVNVNKFAMYAGATGEVNVGPPIGRFGLVSAIFNGAASRAYSDSAASVTVNAGTGSPTKITLGAPGNPVSSWANVEFSEHMLYRGVVGAYDLVRLWNEWIAADRYNIPVTFNPAAPMASYATFNPADSGSNITFSSGNLIIAKNTADAHRMARSTTSVSSGKYYWEVLISQIGGGGSPIFVGVAKSGATLTNFLGQDANGWSYAADGLKYTNGANVAYGATYTTGDRIGVALDVDAGTLTFYKNGVSQGTAFTGLGGTFYAAVSLYYGSGASTVTGNFGFTSFTYAVPSGYNVGLYALVASCAAWFRGSDLGAVDSAISSWADQSGNGRNAIQATGSNQPLVKMGVNGKKGALFDGSNDYLQTAAFTLNQPYTIFAVVKLAAVSDGETVTSNLSGTQAGQIIVDNPGGGSKWYLYSPTGQNTLISPTVNPTILSAVFDGAASLASVDGVATAALSPGTNALNGLTIGASYTLAALSCLTGYIYEIIVYNTALTTAQRQQVEGYLANTYAINAAIRPFDPLSVAGCKGWFDAANVDNPVDTGFVSIWYDKSGNGFHFSATGTDRPVYGATSGPNSLPAVDFSGSDFMESSGTLASMLSASAKTVIVVAVPDVVTGGGVIFNCPPLWCDNAGYAGMHLKDSILYSYNWDTNADYASIPVQVSQPIVTAYRHDGTNLRIQAEGISGVAGTSGASGTTTGVMRIGKDAGGAAFYDGKLCLLLFYNNYVSDADLASLTAWACKKYDIGYKAPNHASLLANLKLWLDSTAITVQADNTDLAAWPDSSGGGFNATQGTGSLQPNYQLAEVNGRPSVEGDGVDDFMQGTNPFGDIDFRSQAITIICAIKVNTSSNYNPVIMINPTTGTNFGIQMVYLPVTSKWSLNCNRADGSSVGRSGFNETSGSGHANGTTHIASMTFDGDGGFDDVSLDLWVDGVSKALSSNPGTWIYPVSLYRLFGDGATFGSHGILQVAVFNIKLSDANRRAVENWMAQQLNIAV